MKLNSTGKNPCGPLAGIRDRDRRPCEGSSKTSATQPVVSARTASRGLFSRRAPSRARTRDADVRSAWLIFLPDILCAMPGHGSAFLPYACAMIFGSVDRRVVFFIVPCATGRSTPMTGTDRFNLSYRTILILFVLLGTPMVARSDILEYSAREMARKVAATLPPRENVALEIRNLSTLMQKEVDRISQAFGSGLQDSGFILDPDGAIHVSVMLSENVKEFLWTAEISRGDTLRVFLTAIPRSLEDRPVSNSMPILLSGEKFWEGPEQILDAVEMTTSEYGDTLLLLQPDGLIIRKKGADAISNVEIRAALAATRTPFGSIQGENACRLLEFSPCVVVTLNWHICTIALKTRSVGECHVEDIPIGRDYSLFLIFLSLIHFLMAGASLPRCPATVASKSNLPPERVITRSQIQCKHSSSSGTLLIHSAMS